MKRLFVASLLLISTQAMADQPLEYRVKCPIPSGALVCTDSDSAHIVAAVSPEDSDYKEARGMSLATGHCKVIKIPTQIVENDRTETGVFYFRGAYLWRIRLKKNGPWRYIPTNQVYDPFDGPNGKCVSRVPD